MEKKYELTKERVEYSIPAYPFAEYDKKVELYKIRALKSFADVKAGDWGGYVDGEHNLSHEGTCWIYKDAIAYENARVEGAAIVKGSAIIYGNAIVKDFVEVKEEAMVTGDAVLGGHVKVSGQSFVSGNAYFNGHQELKVYANAIAAMPFGEYALIDGGVDNFLISLGEAYGGNLFFYKLQDNKGVAVSTPFGHYSIEDVKNAIDEWDVSDYRREVYREAIKIGENYMGTPVNMEDNDYWQSIMIPTFKELYND